MRTIHDRETRGNVAVWRRRRGSSLAAAAQRGAMPALLLQPPLEQIAPRPAGNRPSLKLHLLGGAAVAAILTLSAGDMRARGEAISGQAEAQVSEYALGPQDKIRLRAYEWRPSRDEVFEWAALNFEYTIGASGRVALPLIGEVEAKGLSTQDLAAAIANRLRMRLGLAEAPAISIEVTQCRPFYIVGDVQKPGEYPYRPGLSALQAMSIAGGMVRSPDSLGMRIERDLILARGDIALMDTERLGLMAKRARLEAELKGRDQVQFPAEVLTRIGNPSVDLLVRQEESLFQTRHNSADSAIKALDQLKSMLDSEVQSLTAQLTTYETQIRLVREEFDNVNALLKRGYATAPRKLGLERNLAQLNGDRLRLEGSIARARQEVSKTDISIAELRHKRMNEITVDLRLSQAKIDEIGRKSETSENLTVEAEFTAARQLGRSRSRRTELTYSIVREVGGKSVELAVTEVSRLEPGDTLKVQIGQGGDEPMLEMSRSLMESIQRRARDTAPSGPAVDEAPRSRRVEGSGAAGSSRMTRF